MWIHRVVFVVVTVTNHPLLWLRRILEIDSGMHVDHGPMLGSKGCDCTLERACFLSPRPLNEALAWNTIDIWVKVVN